MQYKLTANGTRVPRTQNKETKTDLLQEAEKLKKQKEKLENKIESNKKRLKKLEEENKPSKSESESDEHKPEKPVGKMNKSELKELLADSGVEYSEEATRNELLDLAMSSEEL